MTIRHLMSKLIQRLKARSRHKSTSDRRVSIIDTTNLNLTAHNLHIMYKNQQGRCAITNMIMHVGGGLMGVSIDRINNELGHSLNNIQLVCQWVNLARGRHDISDIKNVLQAFKNDINLHIVDESDVKDQCKMTGFCKVCGLSFSQVKQERKRKLCVKCYNAQQNERGKRRYHDHKSSLINKLIP